jgi:hypothetical protein
MRRIFLPFVAGLAALCFTMGGSMQVSAEPLAAPTGPVILTITGAITNANDDGAAKFDRDMLEKLGSVTVKTKTPWYDGEMTFEGVSLENLMKDVGATGHAVQVQALNDYSTEIPIDDFAKYHTILALKRNGSYMPIRDKGPLFVVYPYDSNPDLKSQTYYSRSAWQVVRIIVK